MIEPVILIGDVRERLRDLPSQSVHCVVTSPPYWGLRDYGVEGQIGMERTLGEHLDVMVEVFAEVHRVLRQDGTVWLNYGDCFATAPNGRAAADVVGDNRTFRDKPFSTVGPIYAGANRGAAGGTLKNKDLCMVANRLAIALQDWGWWVRQEIIWQKPTAMPESAKDRPTTAHEKIWLLSKGEDYFYNFEAAREPVTGGSHRRAAKNSGPNSRMTVDRTPGPSRKKVPSGWDTEPGAHGTLHRDPQAGRVGGSKTTKADSGIKQNDRYKAATADLVETRNMRSVWTIASHAFKEAHFATFPPKLAERCIVAGTPPTVCGACGASSDCGGLCAAFERLPGHVLDPFGGSGTVGVVAKRMGLRSTLIELNPEYADIARRRIEAGK